MATDRPLFDNNPRNGANHVLKVSVSHLRHEVLVLWPISVISDWNSQNIIEEYIPRRRIGSHIWPPCRF